MEPIASLITDYVANGSFASLKANVRTYKEKNYALFVRTVDFANNFKGDLSYIDKESYDFLEKSNLYGGELMLSNIGASIGKVFKVPHLDTPMSLAPNAIILRFFNDITCDYFEYVFKSFVGQDYLQFLSGGATMPKFNKTDLRAMIVPVPPIKEQERIVESVKNIFIGIDDLDISYSGLANTIQSVKSKILDLAIRGKLVPQDSNDEPASVLLERIRAEKEELIKQGKIKRDKKESVIFKGDDNSYYEKIGNDVTCIDDEIPFDIPPTWNWCRLGTIGDWAAGATPNRKNPEYFIGNIPWLKTGDLNDNYITYMPEHISEKALQHSSLRLNPTGSVLIAMYGATIGKLGILTFPATTNQACCACLPFDGIDNKYLFYYLMSQKSNFIYRGVGGAQSNISKEKIISTLFPLPPKEDQHMILSRIEKLMKLIRQFEELL